MEDRKPLGSFWEGIILFSRAIFPSNSVNELKKISVIDFLPKNELMEALGGDFVSVGAHLQMGKESLRTRSVSR